MNRTFNGARLGRRELVRYALAHDGVELLEASFEHHVYERHIHDTFAIGVTRRGVQRFWCRGKTHDSLPGSVIVIPPGEAHDGQSGGAGGYSYRMFYVPIGRMAALVANASGTSASSVQLRQTCVLREPELARQLDAAWLSMRAQSDSLATDELFSRACAQIDVRHDSDRACRQPLDQPALTRVRDYLHEHLSEHVRLGDLAAIASMSRFQLTRQFARVYGLPLHAYQLHLRLADAKRRLSRGVPIVKVAADLGFADQSHLNRRFKGSFGMTPGAWRDAATHSHLA